MSHGKFHRGKFQHFKHAKKLGWTLETMTPKVKVRWSICYHGSWEDIVSPLFGVNLLLFSLGSALKDSCFVLKAVNYFNRLFVMFVCTLTLVKTFMLWKYLSMDHKWFSVTVILQHLFIAFAVYLLIRSRRHILAFQQQLQARAMENNNLWQRKNTLNFRAIHLNENVNSNNNNIINNSINSNNNNNNSNSNGNDFIDSKSSNVTKRHLAQISLIWSLIYLILSITYTWYYLRTVESKVQSYYSFLFYSIEEVKFHHRIFIYFLYATFVPFVRQNWIVITAGIYLFFIEHLHKVDLLVLKAIKFNRDNYKSQKFLQDPNFILLTHYKDSLIARYEMMRLTRMFESIFNAFPFMWFGYNFAQFFLLCRIIIQQNTVRFLPALINYLIDISVLIFISSRVSQLQSKCNTVASKIILNIETASYERDEVLVNLGKSKRNCPPWWVRSSGSGSSSSLNREIREKTDLTNNYKCMLISQLKQCGSFPFTGWDTFTVRRTLIIIFIESLVTFTVMILQVSGSLIL